MSDSLLLKLIDVLPELHLRELSLSGNHISYFCIESFTNHFREHLKDLDVLDLSNTKMTDKSGIDLFETVIQDSNVRSLNLSRNPGLGFKFSTYSLQFMASFTG